MPRLIVLLAAVALAAATARLGWWQLDRARQKLDLQAAIEERGMAAVLSGAELAGDRVGADAQFHRRVVLEGRWRAEATIFLENRQMHGRPGFYVITPLLLGDGSAVVVQRGWLPRDVRDRRRLSPPPTPGGAVEVTGRIAPLPAPLLELGADEAGPIRQNLQPEAYAREFHLRLKPLSVLQLDPTAPGGLGDGLARDWPQPAIDVSRHHGYAFQWFSLSALTIALYVWFQLVRPRLRRRVP